MANPVDFEGANFVYQGPPGTDTLDLSVFKHAGGAISCWQLTPEELAEVVISNGVIWLSVAACPIPPVYLSGIPLVTIGDRPAKPEPYRAPAPRRPE